MDTLVLNYRWEPLTRISWQKAISLVYAKRAELVKEYKDKVVHSAYLAVPVPAVIRFIRKVRGYFQRCPKFTRRNVWTRDGGKCQYCGARVSRNEFTFDHIIPKSRGGATAWTNIVIACIDCNQNKANRTPEEAKMKLLSRPIEPSLAVLKTNWWEIEY
jgi:5-methylcytosine-specific restriction endonuclease McrA